MPSPVIREIENEDSDPLSPEITLGQVSQDLESELVLVEVQEGLESELNETTISFEDYWNDCNNVATADKNRYLLAAAHGVVPDFNLESYPYNKQTNRVLPTNVMLKQEATRRKKEIKGIRHKKQEALVTLLNSMECSITSSRDRLYIIEQECEIKTFFVEVDK